MSLIPALKRGWDPFRQLRAFEGAFGRFPLPFFDGERGPWVPAIDVYEKDGSIVVKAELPGMKREDLKVSVERDSLVIEGERKAEKETKDEDYYICERAYGSFYRRVPLAAEVDADKAEAAFADGVLTITMPKRQPSEATRTTIKVK
jgi:HSP20 family protein